MSSGVKGAAAGSRVSIPSTVKKTIEDIKEITGQKHSEDDIYAMLRECSMDPNETAQKLLHLDTFHEVKKKRDRRKENLNKEPAESRSKPGSQARANRAGRGSYSSRHMSDDTGGGRNSSAVRESATSHRSEKVVSKAPLATAQDMRKNDASSVARGDSPITDVSNGPSGITCQRTNTIHDNHMSASGGVNQCNETAHTSMSKLEGPQPFSSPVDSTKNSNALGNWDTQKNEMLDSSNSARSLPSAPASGSPFHSSDPVLLPSQNFALSSTVTTIGREAGSQHAPVELIADNLTERKSDTAVQQKVPNEFEEVGKTQYLESLQAASSAIGVSSVSRPSSNYNNQSQVVGPQKVCPGKEWKPKSTSPSIGLGASTAASSEVSTISVGSHPELQQTRSKEATLELHQKLEELRINNSQHVIIPNHLQVPEAGKLGFCFGSFDASFGLVMAHNGNLGSDKSPLLPESSEVTDEPVELQSSNQTVLEAADKTEMEYPDHVQSPSQGPEKFSSSEVEVASSITPDYGESKQEIAPGCHQHPVIHASSNCNYGFMPPILSGQHTPVESSESQARDGPRLPGFIVQQSFDPMSYYAQFYQSGMDSDSFISPLNSAGAANKYNGNAALVTPEASQSPQELQGAAPLVLSTASPVPIVTQAAGIMQSSITATQQPLPVYRQPTGVHLPHYPSFIPYGAYISPFYVSPPAIHQFLSTGAFPQQPQGGSSYPTPHGTTAKYSVSQYKQGSNTGSSTHVGVPGNYGPYGLSVGNYTSSSATAAVTTMSNEDDGAPQVKENNIYVGTYQSEGSGLGFTPVRPGHGAFTGVFQPAQAVTSATVHPLLQQSQAITGPVDMVGPTAGVYLHHQQHTQLNWPSNY